MKKISMAILTRRKSKVLFSLFILIVLLSQVKTDLRAQSLTSLTSSLSRYAVTATSEELVDVTLNIKNSGAGRATGSVTVDVDINLELMSKKNITVDLGPKDSIYIPVKIFVSKKTVAGKEYAATFLLKDHNNELVNASSTKITVEERRKVSLTSLISNVLLDSNSDSVRIPIHMSNTGNTAQKITLLSRIPVSVEETSFHQTFVFTLLPSTDTLISLKKRVTRAMLESEGFDITVTGLYLNNDIAGVAYIRIQSARSSRKYRNQIDFDSFRQNEISVSSQSVFSPSQSYLLRGRGAVELPKGKLGYNLDYTSWRNGYSPDMIRNTWLSYEGSNLGIKAGNISANLDANLTGQGVFMFLNDTAKNSRYEAGFIQGNSNLLSSSSDFFPAGKAGWITFEHANKGMQLISFALYENAPLLHSNNIIWGNNLSYSTKNNFRYYGTFNSGYSGEITNSRNRKFGIAVSAGVSGTLNSFSVSSTNYFSSGYYPGLRKGALSFSERVTWMKGGTSIWGSFDFHRYEPKSLTNRHFLIPAYSMLRAEIGINPKISDEISISIAPTFNNEKNKSYQLPGLSNNNNNMSSWGLTTTLNYPISNNHYLANNTEAGFYISSFDPSERFHIRSNTNYKNGIFNLNASVQVGAFYIGEAAGNFVSKSVSSHSVNITPSVQRSFYQNKLRTDIGISFMNTAYSGNNWYLLGRAEYDLIKKTSLFANYNYNRSNSYSLSMVEIGVTQKVKLSKVGEKSGALNIFLFKDFNLNGVYDATDSVATNYLLYINDDVFLTSRDGRIRYKKLPVGSYRINMPVSKGWYAEEQTITVDRDINLVIPLKRSGALIGTLSYLEGEFSYEIDKNLSGITIIATDTRGNRFTTKTNSDGSYVFYIPFGEYRITIKQEEVAPEVEIVNSEQRIVVEAGKNKALKHILKIKDRKIQTKRFVSPSVSEQNKR